MLIHQGFFRVSQGPKFGPIPDAKMCMFFPKLCLKIPNIKRVTY